MSMIGQSLEHEVFIEVREKEIPYQCFRYAVKPEVISLAQIKYPYGASIEDEIWKHKFDIYNIKHQNQRMELKILFLTVTLESSLIKPIFTAVQTMKKREAKLPSFLYFSGHSFKRIMAKIFY